MYIALGCLAAAEDAGDDVDASVQSRAAAREDPRLNAAVLSALLFGKCTLLRYARESV